MFYERILVRPWLRASGTSTRVRATLITTMFRSKKCSSTEFWIALVLWRALHSLHSKHVLDAGIDISIEWLHDYFHLFCSLWLWNFLLQRWSSTFVTNQQAILYLVFHCEERYWLSVIPAWFPKIAVAVILKRLLAISAHQHFHIFFIVYIVDELVSKLDTHGWLTHIGALQIRCRCKYFFGLLINLEPHEHTIANVDAWNKLSEE